MKEKIKEKENVRKSMGVEIAFPECVHIELVQSNHLRNYEIFIWLSTLFSTATAGFWVAFASVPFNKILFGVSVVFTLFTLVFGISAFRYRAKMNGSKIKKIIAVENFE